MAYRFLAPGAGWGLAMGPLCVVKQYARIAAPILLVHRVASPHLLAVDVLEWHRAQKRAGAQRHAVGAMPDSENEIAVRPFTSFHVVSDDVCLLRPCADLHDDVARHGASAEGVMTRVLQTHLTVAGEECALCAPRHRDKARAGPELEPEDAQQQKRAKRMAARMQLHRALC